MQRVRYDGVRYDGVRSTGVRCIRMRPDGMRLKGFEIHSALYAIAPSMNGEVRYVFVTLKRSFAGTRETHIKILKSLGLRRREQTVQKTNIASVRGAIDKVR